MPTWTQEADIKAEFDSTVESGGGSLADGGALGMTVDITLGTAGDLAYGVLDGTASQIEKTAEVLFDPNGLTMATGDRFTFFIMVGNTGAVTQTIRMELDFNGTVYTIVTNVFNDSAGAHMLTFTTISDAPHRIRMVWKAATGAGANNGYAYVYIDDVLIGSKIDIDNDGYDVDSVRFGAAGLGGGVDAGTGGTFEMVDCRVFDGIEYLVDLSGTLTTSGAILRQINRSLAGTLNMSGNLITSLIEAIRRLVRRRDVSLRAPARITTITANRRDRILRASTRREDE